MARASRPAHGLQPGDRHRPTGPRAFHTGIRIMPNRAVRTAVVALFLAGAGLAAAQVVPPRPPVPPVPPPAGDPPVRVEPKPADKDVPAPYRAKQVLGSKVQIQGDLAIGTVDDIVFTDDGQIEYLIVANEGKLVT